MVYEEIEDMLCSELEGIVKRGELTSNALDIMDKAVDIIKDVKTIQMYDNEKYGDNYGDYYGDGRYTDNGRYGRGRGRYANRDSYGRYRDDVNSSMSEQLQNMLQKAQTEHEKEMIRKWMSQLG